jgi:hypothetical protein
VEPGYTATQGQCLAFIYYYTKIHAVPPAEADMQRYFNVSPPSVHNMIITLEKRGFIKRTPGAGRSIQLLLGRDQLPDLHWTPTTGAEHFPFWLLFWLWVFLRLPHNLEAIPLGTR